MDEQESVSAAYWRGVAQAKERTLDLQAVEFKQRESRWLARISELEAERASWHECYMGAVRTMDEGAKKEDRLLRLLSRAYPWLHGSERLEIRALIEAVLEHAPAETACIEPDCTAPIYTRGGHCQQHGGASPFALNPLAE